MDRQQMIDLIASREPEPLDRLGPVRWHPLVAVFGQFLSGIGDEWLWFDRRQSSLPETLLPGHRFLQDATDDELRELLALLPDRAAV